MNIKEAKLGRKEGLAAVKYLLFRPTSWRGGRKVISFSASHKERTTINILAG